MEDAKARKVARRPIAKPTSKAVAGRTLPAAKAEKPAAKPLRAKNWIYWIAAWYAILTVALRCPSDLESCNESTPRICAPWLRTKLAVVPHLTPYYQTYAEPYLERSRPYYDTAMEQAIVPAYNYAALYAAPRVQQARQYGQERWEKDLQPRLDHYQKQTYTWYDGAVAPHVGKARQAIDPYVELSRSTALRAYNEAVLPAYVYALPFAVTGYSTCAEFATKTVMPTANRTWTTMHIFLDDTVWPHVRVLYTENVEPQLVRIGERLGRHKQDRVTSPGQGTATTDGILQNMSLAASSASDAISSSAIKLSSAFAAIKTQPAKDDTEPQDAQEPKAAIKNDQAASGSADEKIVQTEEDYAHDPRPISEIVADDLQEWESRYTRAAEDGVAAIVRRVDEIAERMVKKDVNSTGKQLLTDLQESVDKETAALKSKILRIAADAAGSQGGSEAVAAAVRRAGLSVKEKAQDVRVWRQHFTEELQVQVSRAAQSNVQILEEIRDLALQKIGMKWAWMDGVTYRDWQDFHDLRSRLTEWTHSVKNLVVTHPGIEDAEAAAQDIEDVAMKIAQVAAKELASIKEVGLWKVASGNTADDFDPKQMPTTDELAVDAETQDDSRQTANTDDEDDAMVQQDSLLGKASAVVDDTLRMAGSLAGDGSLSSDAPLPSQDQASQSASGISQDQEQSPIDDPLVQEAAEQDAQTPVEDGSIGAADTLDRKNSLPEEQYQHDTPARDDESQPEAVISDASDTLSSITGAAKDYASTVKVKPVLFGAAAASVSSNDPILEDEADYLASISQMAQIAYSSAAADAASRYSAASSVVSVQMYGTPQPVHQALMSDLAASYAAATAAASSQLNNVVDAASKGIRGTATTSANNALLPTADWAKAEAIAANKLQEGRVWAEMQYSSVKVAVGLATATPTAGVDQVLSRAKLNYYAGLGMAQERYFNFLSTASSVFNSMTGGPTPTPTPTNLAETAASVASVASASAASAASSLSAAVEDGASVALSAANSLASAAGESIESVIAEVEGGAVEAVKALAGTWDDAVSQISAQVYGQPSGLPWYEDLFDKALPSATDKVAEQVAHATSVVKQAVDKDEL